MSHEKEEVGMEECSGLIYLISEFFLQPVRVFRGLR